MDVGFTDTEDSLSKQDIKSALADARHKACYIIGWNQNQDPIHEWTYLLGQLRNPRDRLEEARHAFNASYEGRPFHRIADIYLSSAERDMERLESKKPGARSDNILQLMHRPQIAQNSEFHKLAAD